MKPFCTTVVKHARSSSVKPALLWFVLYHLPDKLFLQMQFKHVFGRKINWKNPQTFNEKLQWLKIYDRNPLYTKMVDKYEAKKYVAEKIGEKYIIPTLGIM